MENLRISYRSNPIIERMESGKLGPLSRHRDDKERFEAFRPMLEDFWKTFAPVYLKKVYKLTEPFANAVNLSMDKMTKFNLLEELVKEPQYGTVILKTQVICFAITPKEDGNGYLQDVFTFHLPKDKDPLLLAFSSTDANKDMDQQMHYYVSSLARIHPGYKTDGDFAVGHNISLWGVLNFIKFADIQTKELLPGKKIKEFNVKYLNETKTPIQILDSKWFTNLVRSAGFNVRGHFRLQPYKEKGEWTRKLKWINEFEKTGYTSKARKTDDEKI